MVVADDTSVLMHVQELPYMAYMLANNALPATFLIMIAFMLIPQIAIAYLCHSSFIQKPSNVLQLSFSW